MNGEYSNGEKNRKGKEYNSDNKLQFEYLKGKRGNGIEYNYHDKGGLLNYIRVYKDGESGTIIECTGEKKINMNKKF